MHTKPLTIAHYRVMLGKHIVPALGTLIDAGLYLPSIRSEGIETIAFIIDVSGSLATATLAEFWAELRGVAAEIRPERVSASGAENALRAI